MPPIRPPWAALAAAAAVLLLTGCPTRYERRYPAPEVAQVLAHLEAKRDAYRSFNAESTMDYWIGKDRFRGTVLVMGELGAKVRMNALKPDDSVAADLACDGVDFVYVDMMNNCVLTGPCTEASIAQLLRVPLAPDDFLYLALGATPVIPGATGTVRWDNKRGHEIIELEGAGGRKQTIVLDGIDQRWDLLKSEVRGPDGKVIWTVEHKRYREVTDADGVARRVPGASNVRTPQERSDLLVDWGRLRINEPIDEAAFVLEPPPVPTCGRQG